MAEGSTPMRKCSVGGGGGSINPTPPGSVNPDPGGRYEEAPDKLLGTAGREGPLDERTVQTPNPSLELFDVADRRE